MRSTSFVESKAPQCGQLEKMGTHLLLHWERQRPDRDVPELDWVEVFGDLIQFRVTSVTEVVGDFAWVGVSALRVTVRRGL